MTRAALAAPICVSGSGPVAPSDGKESQERVTDDGRAEP